MIDSDIHPDIYLGKTFVDSSLAFMFDVHTDPCVIAAPYCGIPPHENIYVFHWAGFETGTPNDHWQLAQYTRELAHIQAGITEVAAIPTGLVLMDMRIFKDYSAPWFYYDFTDEYALAKASTEDVTFSRNVSICGHKIFCNWDCWAGHYKTKLVQKPSFLSVDEVRKTYVEAWERNQPKNQQATQLRSRRFPKKNVSSESSNGVPKPTALVPKPTPKAPKKKAILPKKAGK